MKKTFTKQFEWVMGMTGSTSCFSPTRRLLLLLCLILVGVGGAKAQSDVTFNEGVRYSQWVIDSRLGDFYGNTNDFGFTTYNRDLSVKKEVTKWKDGSVSPYIDYVPGLVAKATIEAADYYQNFDWAKPWFKSVEWYGNACTVPTSPDNLDAINASKMYFGIYSLTNSTDGAFKGDDGASTTASKATTELGNALAALKSYSTNYAFPTSTTLNGKDITGGWYHKSSYSNQMWLDGQYMGPALLAQLINGYSSYSSNKVSDNDWELVTKQFSIVWEQCWDETEKLLYHAFSSEELDYWAGDAEIWTTAQTNKESWECMTAAGHSAAFWGRAEGWYFLALVDVLEQMQIDGLDKESVSNHSYYTTLKGYLDKLALGIAKRQDATSGCWYQLIGKSGDYSAQYYNGADKGVKQNYLESSCTAIFAAAFLKATRLGLLSSAIEGTTTYDYKAIGTNAYKGAVKQFMKQRADGTVDLLGCCKSAGVGTAALGEDRFRDGSNAYYLHGYDVTPTSTNSGDYYTEGKVMGAFIMAATEYERANEKAIRFSYDLAPAYTLTQGDALTVEALGSGAESATYQWYKDDVAICDATSASYIPTESGSCYCEATSGTTTIQTSTANVTLTEAVVSSDIFSLTITYNKTYSLASGQDLNLTSDYADVTGGTALVHNGRDGAADIIYLKNSSGNIALNGSNSTYAKLTINTPLQVGDVITFTSDENSIGSFYLTSSDTRNTNCPVISGTYTITATDGLEGAANLYVWNNISGKFKSITITRTGTSSGTPSNDASATFTYNEEALTFTDNTATINLESTQAGSTITVNATPAAGATIAMSSGNTSIINNVISITAPAAGSSASYVYKVTAEDGTSQNYTIHVIVAPVLYTVTFNAGSNGSCSTSSLTQSSQGGTISLPSVTANEGYTFDGWYTAETGGTKVGDAEATYEPTEDVTLYAHYTETSTGGGETGGSGTGEVVYFNTKGSNESTNTSVVDASEATTTTGSVTYNGTTYTNGVKLQSNKVVNLTLSSSCSVTLVFRTADANNTVTVGTNTYTVGSDGTIKISELAAGTYEIKKSSGESHLYAVDIQPTGPSISFTTQPSNKACAQGVSVSLTVAAAVNNDTGSEYGDVTYQWYSNTTESNEISGATNASYSPSTSELGTTYYYCVATATKTADESQNLTATSNVVAVTVSEPSIEFTTQPQGAVYTRSEKETATALSVVARTNFNETVSYQWYSKTTEDSETGTPIDGETNATYTPSITTSGKTYYYCVASSSYTYNEATNTYTITSDVVCVEVVNALYKYTVTSSTDEPNCNDDRYIEDGSGNKLVKFTFGGWKWGTNEGKNDHSYTKPNGTTTITDKWSSPSKQAKVNALDGYEYAITGNNDAVQEDKTASFDMYGSTRYGWFKSPTRDANGVTKESHPYTLPVRGAYMTFEPTQNGTLTIYLLQNGAWNTDGNNDIIPGEFRMHAFQITNQRGLVLEEFAPKYSVTCNQKVLDGYSCTVYETDPHSYDSSSKDISNWEEFWKLSPDERKAVHDNWNNGTNGSQKIIKLDNGSFLAIQKAIVKYEFHVTGNETYYMFSNFSKLGFSGATFQPDETQPTDETTFSGDNSLSDTKEFTKITATATENKISGTEMTEYKFMIGEKEVGKVDGVFIPQFKAITLERTFTANQWTTLTLPFNLTQTEVQEIFGSGTQLIQLDNATVDNGCARLEFVYHEIQNVLPGYPYLIKPTQTLSTFTVSNKCINPMIDQTNINCGDYTFKGVPGYSKPGSTSISGKDAYSVNFKENDIFVSDGNGQMYVSAGSSYGKGYRAWFEKKTDDTSTSGKINSISLVIDNPGDDDDNVVTTIDMVDVDPDVFNALGVATGVYNLNGQKVSDDMRSLPKGIYIVNGKKIVRK